MELELSFSDTLRAMYFFDLIKSAKARLGELLRAHSRNPELAVMPLLASLSEEADRITLGVLPFEIRSARRKGLLSGGASQNRYQSFFFNKSGWTEMAKGITAKYPRLMRLLEGLFANAANNVAEMLKRLETDREKIQQVIKIFSPDQIRQVLILDGDPHNNGRQPLLIVFESGKKLIYKPTPLLSYKLVGELVKQLELPALYQLEFPKMVLGEGYGWMEWIENKPCHSEAEVRAHFANKGALLLLAYILNFNDGHADNVIAVGPRSVIADGETWFHNHSAVKRSKNGQYSILDTYLIADPESLVEDEVIFSVFQSVDSFKNKTSEAFAAYERTPRIRTKYGVLVPAQTANLPTLGGRVIGPGRHVDVIIEGFLQAGNAFKAQKEKLLNDNTGLWQSIAKSRSRFIARPTRFYLYARSMTRRPECLVGEQQTRRMLEDVFAPGFKSESRTRVFTKYEVEALLNGDVPIFHTVVGESHLYDGRGKCYENFFPESALVQVRRNIEEVPRVEKQIEIIRRVLTP